MCALASDAVHFDVLQKMKVAKKVALIGIMIFSIAVVALLFTDIGRKRYSSVAADFPESWCELKPGMISDDARKLVGEPWADGRDLKNVDRWRLSENGVELHMDLWFENQNDGNSTIARVSRWKRFMGLDTEKHVDPQ